MLFFTIYYKSIDVALMRGPTSLRHLDALKARDNISRIYLDGIQCSFQPNQLKFIPSKLHDCNIHICILKPVERTTERPSEGKKVSTCGLMEESNQFDQEK